MRPAHALLLGVLAASSAACLRNTAFHCDSSADCGPGGTCQTGVGFCSFVDNDCSSQQRYGDSAGTYAGQCVDGGGGSDGGTSDSSTSSDAPSSDAASDAPSVGCPAGYNAIAGGQTGRLYRLVTTTANWPNQRDFCTSTSASAYLAIPDDAGELAGLMGLATSTRFWVGVTDQVTEGTWLNTKGATQTFLPWANGAPNGGNNQDDCVAATDPGGGAPPEFVDDRCGSTQLPAICECEP